MFEGVLNDLLQLLRAQGWNKSINCLCLRICSEEYGFLLGGNWLVECTIKCFDSKL